MKLFELPEFEQAVLAAEVHFRAQGLRAAVIEKDYFVTEALRLVSKAAADKAIFKGGTSLSKGWSIIQRFSEDIDIFLDPQAFATPPGKNAIDRELKKLRNAVATHPALRRVPAESKTIGGFGRSDSFAYERRFGGVGDVASRILLEAGTASGRQPVEHREIQSYLGQFLHETRRSLGAEDESGFTMVLLHFRRTFVEKMFAIHGKVELLKRDRRPLGPYARHYYDLYQLVGIPDVPAMLEGGEYRDIREDYDRISREHFARDYLPPEHLSFAGSDALFPPTALASAIGPEYERQCRVLCYGAYPSWGEVLARFLEIRSLL